MVFISASPREAIARVIVSFWVSLTGREIAHIVDDAEPRALVSETYWTLAEIVRETIGMSDAPPEVSLDGDAPAGIIYTSGTTGTSSGAALTRNNFAINPTNLVACWSITAAGSRPFFMCSCWATGFFVGWRADAGCDCWSDSDQRFICGR
jgi:acyl-CoA synthetase (AMP-forming)/AMP-acid ligase II